MRDIDDYEFALLGSLLLRPAHPPIYMTSLSTRGPIKSWYCPECVPFAREAATTYTFCASDSTPVCRGSQTTIFRGEDRDLGRRARIYARDVLTPRLLRSLESTNAYTSSVSSCRSCAA